MDVDASFPSAELLATHGSFLKAIARGLIGDEQLAEDVAQEALVRAGKRGPREPRALRRWLVETARHLSIDLLRERSRRHARERRVARAEALPSAETELARTEVLRSVVDAVLALEEPYRTTILLSYWRGWSAARIAEESRIPLATVRSRLQRAHERIRTRLDRAHDRRHWLGALGFALPRAGWKPVLWASTSSLLKVGAGVALTAGMVAWLWRTHPAHEPELGPRANDSAQPQTLATREPEESVLPGSAERAQASEAPTSAVLVRGRMLDRACPELGLVERAPEGLSLEWGLHEERYDFGKSTWSGTTTVAADGSFRIDLPEGSQRLRYLRLKSEVDERYRAFWWDEELPPPGSELQLYRAAHGILHGLVLDDRGRPLAGARVLFRDKGDSLEASSAADGGFALPGLRLYGNPECELAGYTMLQCERPRPLEEGGFAPIVIRMSQEAALELVVEDEQGQALPGVIVAAGLHASELSILSIGSFDEPAEHRATTDAEGRATLSGLWAGRRLELSLRVDRQSTKASTCVGGELCLDRRPGEGERPIVLAVGRVAGLRARLPNARPVAGSVRYRDGAPAAGARVEVREGEAANGSAEGALLATFEADASGSFAGEARALHAGRGWSITATANAPGSRPALGGMGYSGAASPQALVQASSARTELLLARGMEAALARLELLLDPLYSIEGVLLGQAGERFAQAGAGSRLWAAPSGAAPSFDSHMGRIAEDGGFRIEGLGAGDYDLYVSEELEAFYSFQSFLHAFPSIPAGTRGLELRIPERKVARILVSVRGAERPSGVVLHRKLLPRAPRSLAVPEAGAVTSVSGAHGWPLGASLSFTGIGGAREELGDYAQGYDGLEWNAQGVHELRPLEPGWYQIGLHATGAEGEPDWYPQLTPLLYFGEGEHRIEFELLPAAELQGHLLGATTDEIWAVRVIDGEGQPLVFAPATGYCRPASLLETNAAGDFVLRLLPAGKWRLQAGTRRELESGVFRRELELELRPGRNEPVELRL